MVVDFVKRGFKVEVYRIKRSFCIGECCVVLTHNQELCASRLARDEAMLVTVEKVVEAEMSGNMRSDDFLKDLACDGALLNGSVIRCLVFCPFLVYGRNDTFPKQVWN